MTAPTPAQLAAVDQLLAAHQAVARQLRRNTSTAEEWPNVGPVTGPIIVGMWLDLGAVHATGDPVVCDHLQAAIDWGVWFPWLPRWLCVPCAWAAIDERATDVTCDACDATPNTWGTPRLWSIGIPSHLTTAARVKEIEPNTANPGARLSPPLLARILLCTACDTRNRKDANQ